MDIIPGYVTPGGEIPAPNIDPLQDAFSALASYTKGIADRKAQQQNMMYEMQGRSVQAGQGEMDYSSGKPVYTSTPYEQRPDVMHARASQMSAEAQMAAASGKGIGEEEKIRTVLTNAGLYGEKQQVQLDQVSKSIFSNQSALSELRQIKRGDVKKKEEWISNLGRGKLGMHRAQAQAYIAQLLSQLPDDTSGDTNLLGSMQ